MRNKKSKSVRRSRVRSKSLKKSSRKRKNIKTSDVLSYVTKKFSLNKSNKSHQLGGRKQLYKDSKKVKELTNKDFDVNNKLKNISKPGIVMMYADWCPHCNNPDTILMWNKLGSMMDEQNGWVGAFNCADEFNSKIASNLKVEGYPTIMFVDKTGEFYNRI